MLACLLTALLLGGAGALVTVDRSLVVQRAAASDSTWLPLPRAARGRSKYQRLKVAVMLEGHSRAESGTIDERAELACLHTLFAACTALSPLDCFRRAVEQDRTCTRVFAHQEAEEDYKQWWQSVFIRAMPTLQRLGWTDISLVPGFQDHEAWSTADVVVMRYNGDAGALQKLFREGKATQRYVLLDRGDSSTLSPGYSFPTASWELVENSRVAAILRQTVAWPPALQNGPLFYGRSHLARYVAASEREYRRFSNATLSKIHPLLPTTVRYRFPWSLGSTLDFARYAGFYHASLRHHWAAPPLRDRAHDVAFLGKVSYREEGAGPIVTRHRQRIMGELDEFARRFEGRFTVLSPHGRESDYPRFVETLLQTKVFISPWGWGEWSGKDYEAIMAGCLLVKPMLGNIRQYPDIYQPGVTAFSMDAPAHGAGNLTHVLLRSLVDLERSQALVDAAVRTVRAHAEPDAYAADLSDLLVEALRESEAETKRRGGTGKATHTYRHRSGG